MTSLTETHLVSLWQKVLNTKVDLRDNFFEIGGNSFLALRLGEEIERSFEKSVPIGIVFYMPTIGQLAAYLDEGKGKLPTGLSLVPLQTEGVGRPIFVVHWTIPELVRHLGKNRPIYALSFGLAAQKKNSNFPLHIEALADHYITEMREAQATGPYTLLGYSAGGVVAYEMAQQLRSDGECIDFLGMIDTYVPRDFFAKGDRLPLHHQISNLFKLSPREIYGSLKFWYLDPLFHKLQPYQHQQIVAYSDFMMSTSEFWMSYVPKPYPGKLTIFKSTGVASVRNETVPPERFWMQHAQKVEIHEVPGRHLSVVRHDPYTRVLASKLQACLG